jgi:hypothetical protein
VIVVDPTEPAETRPLDETDATALFELDHEIAIPVTTFPDPSFRVAFNCSVRPGTIEDEPGLTVTDETADLTWTTAVPVTPSAEAVIVAHPTVPAVTRPLEETGPAALLFVDHVIGMPVSVPPDASFNVAFNCTF